MPGDAARVSRCRRRMISLASSCASSRGFRLISMRPVFSVGVGAVDADERGQALDVGVLQDRRRPACCWQLAPSRSNDTVCGASVMRLDQAGVLHREEALGDRRCRAARSARACRARPAGSAPGGRAPSQRRGRSGRSACRTSAAPSASSLLALLALRAWRWRSSCAHIIGTRVSDTTAEIRMVTASVTANSRNSRPTTSPMNSSGISTAISDTVSEMMVKPICAEPFSAACERRLALLDVARDVLDHHDRVVDHEAGGDGQRHQRQVVEADSPAGTSRRACRPATAAPTGSGSSSRAGCAGTAKITSTTSTTASSSSISHVVHRGADGRACGRSAPATSSDGGRVALQRRQQRLDAVDHGDDVGAGLALDVEDDRLASCSPRRRAGCSPALASTLATSRRRTGAPFR